MTDVEGNITEFWNVKMNFEFWNVKVLLNKGSKNFDLTFDLWPT